MSTVILLGDGGRYNPEAAYVVSPLQDGRVDVTMTERHKTLFHMIYPHEAAAVNALNARIKPLVYGPPGTSEDRERSKVQLEAMRQEMLAHLTPEQRRELKP